MNKSLTIVVNKLLYKIGKLKNKGSSMPGQVALKLTPDILSKIKMPKNVIVVTRK